MSTASSNWDLASSTGWSAGYSADARSVAGLTAGSIASSIISLVVGLVSCSPASTNPPTRSATAEESASRQFAALWGSKAVVKS